MSYERYKDFRLAPDDNGCWDVLNSDYEQQGTYPSHAAAKRAIDEMTAQPTPTNQEDIESVLADVAEYFREVEHSDVNVRLYEDKGVLTDAAQAINTIIANKCNEARIKEAETIIEAYQTRPGKYWDGVVFLAGSYLKDRLAKLQKGNDDAAKS